VCGFRLVLNMGEGLAFRVWMLEKSVWFLSGEKGAGRREKGEGEKGKREKGDLERKGGDERIKIKIKGDLERKGKRETSSEKEGTKGLR
jgi:hypothetical protein